MKATPSRATITTAAAGTATTITRTRGEKREEKRTTIWSPNILCRLPFLAQSKINECQALRSDKSP